MYQYQELICRERGDHMPSGIEVIKTALEDFKKIQEYMFLAKKENAAETYARLKGSVK